MFTYEKKNGKLKIMSSENRVLDEPKGLPSNKEKIVCSLFEKCDRKNLHHFEVFDHPHLDDLLNKDESTLELLDNYLDKETVMVQLKILIDLNKPAKDVWKDFQQGCAGTSKTINTSITSTNINTSTAKSNFASKLKCNAPYNLFFTIIPDSPQTKNQHNSLQLTDLLCPSLGNLKCTLQINFLVDIMWLMEEYAKTGNEKKPMTLLFGMEGFEDMEQYIARYLPNVTPHFVELEEPFGIQHSKVGVYAYTDGSLRVVVSTANLYDNDWNIYCQGVWVSPLCPALPSDKSDIDGSGPTDFKGSLITYLRHYKLSILDEWIQRIKRADFSEIKVFFVASVPGYHRHKSAQCHLYRISDLLSRHCTIPDTDNPIAWSIFAQSSSLGNFGKNPADWLQRVLLRSLASHKEHQLPENSNAKISIIYPTYNNVMNSYNGAEGGGCLPYRRKTHKYQRWLEDYLYEWKADRTHRTRAMPHSKSYCRISPCFTKLAYFLLTSANISKSAWGFEKSSREPLFVRSYEVGVLFMPSYFDEPYFSIDAKHTPSSNLFPFMYDLPLVPYKATDTPWWN